MLYLFVLLFCFKNTPYNTKFIQYFFFIEFSNIQSTMMPDFISNYDSLLKMLLLINMNVIMMF